MIDRRLFALPKILPTLLGLVVLTGLQAFSVLAQGILLAWVLTQLWHGAVFSAVIWPTVGFVVSFILRHLLHVLKNEWMSRYAEIAVETYRVQLLEKYAQLGPVVVQEMGTGSAVATLGAGLDNVKNYFQLLLVKVFDLGIIPWVILLGIAYFDWELAVFLLVIFPVIILFFIILGYAAQSKADAEYANFTNLNNRFVDALRGLPTLKQLGLSRSYAQQIFAIAEDYRLATMRTLRIAMTSTFALDFFTTLSVAIVAVFLGLDLLDGVKVLFPALSVLILAPEYFLPLRNFADDYHATLDGKNALDDVFAILAREVPHVDAANLPKWDADSTLALRKLDVAYSDSTDATLENVSLTIDGLQKIALVGTSGAGKTTLLETLAGFLTPSAGEIVLNGTTLPSLAHEDWQRQFFYMPQNPYLFATTLRENIVFYAPNASDERIDLAVQQAGLQTLVADLPDGLETVIGEGGRQLSGGQAQRVALARMLVDAQRSILLFDEPTAHLDIATEAELKATMAPLFANKLVIFATHRLHWLTEMDAVIVMRDGQIVETGTPKALLADPNSALNALRSTLKGDEHATN